MSLKIHCLRSPIDLGIMSDKRGEHFHQEIKRIQERYQR